MNTMNENIEAFYTELRKVKEGKFAIFLGAGSSYDYGIPTMAEMAIMLEKELQNPKTAGTFDFKTIDILCAITGISKDKGADKKSSGTPNSLKWNIEDLLTRLQHLLNASQDDGTLFPKTTTSINKTSFSKEALLTAEKALIKFMVDCYQLDAADKPPHGDRAVEYLANFIEFVGGFHNSISIFTTNNDLCIEAAIIRLSQRQKNLGKKEFYLVDGFSHGILPNFSIANFSSSPTITNRVAVYLWKLHGSVDWVFLNPIKPSTSQKEQDAISSNYNFGDESIICKNIDPGILRKFQNAGAISKDIVIDNLNAMIFPTPSKYSQTFNNPYMDLYQAFRRTLETIEFFLVVGTSFPDAHINSAIKSFLGRETSMMYSVNPGFTREQICKILGECRGLQPVIQMGFKDFIIAMQTVESAKEDET
ncbi:MAG TPA: hypothetical protein ENI23_02465 [bacterium]|nr:hypothetical protein [bacterium]